MNTVALALSNEQIEKILSIIKNSKRLTGKQITTIRESLKSLPMTVDEFRPDSSVILDDIMNKTEGDDKINTTTIREYVPAYESSDKSSIPSHVIVSEIDRIRLTVLKSEATYVNTTELKKRIDKYVEDVNSNEDQILNKIAEQNGNQIKDYEGLTDEDIVRILSYDDNNIGKSLFKEYYLKELPNGDKVLTSHSGLGFAKANTLHRMQLKKVMIKQLRDIRLDSRMLVDEKRSETIRKFREKIRTSFNRALVESGETLGTIAAASIGQPAMQMNLNTFHSAGAGKSAHTFSRLDQLTRVPSRDKIKSISSLVAFRDRDTCVEDIFMKERHQTVQVRLNNFVVKTELLSYTTIDDEYKQYLLLDPLNNPDKTKFQYDYLRLHLDKIFMAKYEITMNDVAKSIRAVADRENVSIVSLPFSDAVIDIHPTTGVITLKNIDATIQGANIGSTYIQAVFLPTLTNDNLKKTFTIGGIHEVSGVEPVERPVADAIYRSVSVDDNKYRVEYALPLVNHTPLTRDVLLDAMKYVGITVNSHNDDYAIVTTTENKAPEITMNNRLNEARKKHSDLIYQMQVDKRLELVRPNEDILNLTITMMRTIGSNMLRTFRRTDIDPHLTCSDEINEVNSVLGLNAARNILLTEMYRVFSDTGESIDPRHLEILVDSMSYSGVMTGMGLASIRMQSGGGVLTEISFNKAGQTIKDSVGGRKEKIVTASASIFTGTEGRFGTGAVAWQMTDDYDMSNAEDEIDAMADDLLKTRTQRAPAITSNVQQLQPNSLQPKEFTSVILPTQPSELNNKTPNIVASEVQQASDSCPRNTTDVKPKEVKAYEL
jgi:hypothetical protein